MMSLSRMLKNLMGTSVPPGEQRLPPVPLGWRPRAAPPGGVPQKPVEVVAPEPREGQRAEGGESSSTGVPKTAHPWHPEGSGAPAYTAPGAEARERDPGVRARVAGRSGALIATEADVAMMRRALDLAREALKLGEVPVGAVVYDTASGRILGEAFNRRETDKDPTAHAELLAVKAAAETVGDWRLNHCTLVVTLEPCVMCSGVIVNARVGRVVYGARDPKAGAVESLYRLTSDPRLNHRVMPVPGVLEEEAGTLLKEFFEGVRKNA
jgi:tRNA(adenine34) deaminase